MATDRSDHEGQQISPVAAWKKIEERLDTIDRISREIHEFAEKIEEKCREALYNRGDDDPKQVLKTISSLAAEIRRRT